MDTSLSEFNVKRKKISDILLEIISNIEKYGLFLTKEGINNSISLKSIKELIKHHSQSILNESFKVMIVGEFSTGKSTFLNALLNENILPMAIKPTTSTINLIKYAEIKKINLHYWGEFDNAENEINSGKIETISVEQLKEYSTSLTSEYDEKSKKIKLVEILYPIELCKNGIEILDTPGLSSTNKQHDKVTLDYLPRGHTAIMLLNPSQPLSKSEREYIKLVKNYLNRVIFVVNKIDNLDEKDRNIAIEYLNNELIKELNSANDLLIFPLSAKQALKGDYESSNFKKFQLEFEKFLTSSDKAKEFIYPPIFYALNISEQFINEIMSISSLIEMNAGNYETDIEEAKGDLNKILDTKKRIEYYLNENTNLRLSKFNVVLKNSVYLKLNDISRKLLTTTFNEIEDLKKFISDFVTAEINQLMISLQEEVYSEVKEFREDVESQFSTILANSNSTKLVLFGKNDLYKPNIYVANPKISTDRIEQNNILGIGAGFGAAIVAFTAIGGPLGVALGFISGKIMNSYILSKLNAPNINDIAANLIARIEMEFEKTIPITLQKLSDEFANFQKDVLLQISINIDNMNNKLVLLENKRNGSIQKANDKIKELTLIKDRFINCYNSLKLFLKEIR